MVKFATIICTILISSALLAAGRSGDLKMIYGDDNRQNVKDYHDPIFQSYARSVAVQINRLYLQPQGETQFKITSPILGVKAKLCPEERFYDDVAAGNCTGFLITPQIILTAGHCARNANFCKYENRWIFGVDDNSRIIDKENIYLCSQVLAQKVDRKTNEDYAVILLDRPVKGRESLQLNLKEEIAIGTDVLVIGHPRGIPTKIADGAYVRANDRDISFSTNLDTFEANSGSPVFNKQTGLIEGILVFGDEDWEIDQTRNCNVNKKAPNDGGTGEDVMRISSVPNIQKYLSPDFQAPTEPSPTAEELLDSLLLYSPMVHSGTTL